MSVVDPPLPAVAAHGVSGIDVEALQHDLAAPVDGEARFEVRARAAHSTDASSYRQIPVGLVLPRSVDAVVDAVGGREGVHLAELLAAAVHEVSRPPGEWPERVYASRPDTPTLAWYTALAAVLGAALVTAGAVVRGIRR